MPQFVQKTDNFAAATGTSRATVWGGNPANGNAVVVSVFWKGAFTVTSVTDSQGNTYTDCGAGALARPTDGFLQVFVATKIQGGTTPTVTVNFSGSATSIDVCLAEYQADPGCVLLLDSVFATGTGTSGTSVTTGSFTPTTSAGVVVAFSETDDTNASAGASMTIRSNPAGAGAGVEDRIYGSSPGSITASMTMSTAITKGGIVAAVLKQVSMAAPLLGSLFVGPRLRY